MDFSSLSELSVVGLLFLQESMSAASQVVAELGGLVEISGPEQQPTTCDICRCDW